MNKVEQIWTAALGELRLQMTQATFDTWVRDTQAVEFDDGCLVVGVKSAFARDWLENRLKTTVERTLTGILGYPVRVAFLVVEGAGYWEPERAGLVDVVEEEEEGGLVAVKFYEFNPKGRGWLQTAKYDYWFWQPLLGCVAFATYQFLRTEERINEGWGDWFVVTVEEIAATLSVGRQAITGVERKKKGGGKYWQEGAFDRLQAAAVARVETLGKGRNVSYRVSCLHSLPLLTPQQVEILPPVLQVKHAKFLKEASIEYEEWMQLELPSLVQS